MGTKHSTLDFETLKVQKTPNRFLMLPKWLKSPSRADAASPVFNKPASETARVWFQVLRNEPEVFLSQYDLIRLQFDFVQRSAIFNFKDNITVQFMEIGHASSTLAVYSRSRLGIYDFGVNRKRVTRWVSLTQKALQQKATLNSLPHLAQWVNLFPRE